MLTFEEQAFPFGIFDRKPDHDDGVHFPACRQLLKERPAILQAANAIQQDVDIGIAQDGFDAFHDFTEEPP